MRGPKKNWTVPEGARRLSYALATIAMLLQTMAPLAPMKGVALSEQDRALAFVLSLADEALCLSGDHVHKNAPALPADHSAKCPLCLALHLIGPALIAAALLTILLPQQAQPLRLTIAHGTGPQSARSASRPRAPPLLD
jgi:hypothetical protein